MKELIEKIKNAFQEAEFPGNENLVSKSYGEEPESVRKHFENQNDWQALTSKFLNLNGAVSFLSDQAFRFYVPAFIIADIKDELEFSDPSVRLCWSLTAQSENQKIAKIWGGGTVGERAKECFKHFSAEQVGAIISYLEWKTKDGPDYCISEALENYWLKRINNDS